ncbi:MAG: MBL fold metallo-hydrolase [Nanohaloarchaea archaeon]|nr:MBL fold metallo-hydrolase [Candidatus Nanohaloarchaea archaeon]
MISSSSDDKELILMDTYTYNNVKVSLLGHASTMIVSDKKTIYIDPYIIPDNSPRADIILVTHEHFDHCAPDKITQLSNTDTQIVAPKGCAQTIKNKMTEISVGKTIDIDNIRVTAVEAYNIKKQFHPKGMGMGYIIEIDSVKIYHAGDTDRIPEMKELKDIDIAFLPVGGTYTMDIVEASDAVTDIMPKVVVPMHYGAIEGTEADIDEFKRLVEKKASGVKVRVL